MKKLIIQPIAVLAMSWSLASCLSGTNSASSGGIAAGSPSNTSSPSTQTPVEEPITDELVAIDVLGASYFQGHQGGLYPNGENVAPASHRTKISAAANIVKNAVGTKVFLSIGASNSAMEMETFMADYAARADKNPNLKMVNGSLGAEGLEDMLEDDYIDSYVISQLTAAASNANQVYVIWLKTCALRNDLADFTFSEYIDYEKDLYVQLVTKLKAKFPNLALIYVTGRHTTKFLTENNGTEYRQHFEPRALYEQFSLKDLIADQINGADAALNYAVAPVLVWANPFFTDGVNPNSFGHQWGLSDFNASLLHPSPAGKIKASQYLMNFFTTNTYTTRWFLN